MVNFGLLTAEMRWRVWVTPANFNGFRVLAALLHGTLVVSMSQTLWRWTEGATYIWQGEHHVGYWPTFLVFTVLEGRGKIIGTIVYCIVYDSCAQRTRVWKVFTGIRWFRFMPCQRLWINSNNLLSNTSLSLEAAVDNISSQHPIAFSALTLLVGRQEEHLAGKN